MFTGIDISIHVTSHIMLPRHLTALTSQKWQGVKWNLITWLACWCKYLFVWKPKTNKLHRKQSLKDITSFRHFICSKIKYYYQRLDLIGSILDRNVTTYAICNTWHVHSHYYYVALIVTIRGDCDEWPMTNHQTTMQCGQTMSQDWQLSLLNSSGWRN